MGTRHLIAVHIDGNYKVAQYAQFDGYPEGAGAEVLAFLSAKTRREKLQKAARKCTFVPHAELVALGSEWLKKYPQMSRDHSAEILALVANNDGLPLRDSLSFASDSVFCEWAYVVDFDKGTFEVFKGFNHEPLPDGARFKDTPKEENLSADNHPVRMVKSWSLDALPTNAKFLKAFAEEEEPAEA